MSHARCARERNAQPKGETYSRADEALWDDEYLLKLFNEQLENSGAVSEAAHSSDPQSSASRISEAETGEDDALSASSGSRSSTSSRSSMDHKRKRESKTTGAAPVAASSAPSNLHLPEDIQALVQSFYNAGFEAGRYVGRAEAKEGKSRKRHR